MSRTATLLLIFFKKQFPVCIKNGRPPKGHLANLAQLWETLASILCLDDSFAHPLWRLWHSLNQRHLEYFSNSLVGVPTYAELLLAAFPSLCGRTHPKLSPLGWGRVIVEARSSDAALHPIPSWSNSPYTPWRCVWSLPCWKTNDCPTKPKPGGWRITAECCGSHAA